MFALDSWTHRRRSSTYLSPFYMVYKPQPIQLEFADNNEEKRELRWFPTILVKRIQMHSSPSDAFFENKEASVASLYLPSKMGYFTSFLKHCQRHNGPRVSSP